MLDVLEMLTRDYSEAEAKAAENRRKFSAGGELKDMFLRGGIDGQIFHAANFETGDEIGTEPDEYCRRFGGVPCTYWPNGAPA